MHECLYACVVVCVCRCIKFTNFADFKLNYTKTSRQYCRSHFGGFLLGGFMLGGFMLGGFTIL